MSKLEHKFEHHWGGEDNWYTKGKRWANKQKFPINYLALGFIEWLRERWIDGRVELEMESVEKQAQEIKDQWDKEDEQNRPKPEIVETGVFGEEAWSISISNPVVERRTEGSIGSVGSGSDEKGLENPFPDPWEGDWNDGVYIWERLNKERSL